MTALTNKVDTEESHGRVVEQEIWLEDVGWQLGKGLDVVHDPLGRHN